MPVDDKRLASILFQTDRVASGNAVERPKRQVSVCYPPHEVQIHFRWVERTVDSAAVLNVEPGCVGSSMRHRRSFQIADEGVAVRHRQECEAPAGTRHGDIVESAFGVAVIAIRRPVPTAVENDDMVELQSLGPVR